MYRCKSAGSTNQPEPISIEFPMSRGSNPQVATKAKGKNPAKQAKEKGKLLKPKAKKQTKEKGQKDDVLFESPAMGTRSKKN
jgi:hypothetical protein